MTPEQQEEADESLANAVDTLLFKLKYTSPYSLSESAMSPSETQSHNNSRPV